MDKRLPSLHLMKIFECAGKHLSFKEAANELHLTPSAVSHQIKALEDHLGFALFIRHNRRIELTTGGRAFWSVIHDGLNRINRGAINVLSQFGQRRIKISLTRSLASHFLIPRISSLQERMPEVEWVIEASSDIVDFNSSDVDLGIRFGKGKWPDVIADKITDTHVSPMCSPKLAQTLSLGSVHDLTRAPLISFSFMTDGWLKFKNAYQIPQLKTDNSLTFSNYDMAIQAAEQGLGVVLGLIELEQSQLDKQTLTCPFDIKIPRKEALYLVFRDSDKDRDDIKQFASWLKEQFASQQS